MKKYLINEGGNFYKANLHCHTTLSDGRLTPEQIKENYKEDDVIDFIVNNCYKTLPEEDFIELSVVENEEE